jgi:ABC-type transporter Mla maintaining outer membrane lipid asymmetry permease subunit MlaE
VRRIAGRRARDREADTVAALFNGINSIGRDAPPVTMTAEHFTGMILTDRAFTVLADAA